MRQTISASFLAVLLMVLSILAAAAGQSQNAGTANQAPPQTPAPIRVGTDLVVEEVTVKDKSGKPIEGLTANDFVLTEDGVPQTISFVQFQRLAAPDNSTTASPPPNSSAVKAP